MELLAKLIRKRTGFFNLDLDVPFGYKNAFGTFRSYSGILKGDRGLRLNFLLSGSDEIYSVDYFEDFSDPLPKETIVFENESSVVAKVNTISDFLKGSLQEEYVSNSSKYKLEEKRRGSKGLDIVRNWVFEDEYKDSRTLQIQTDKFSNLYKLFIKSIETDERLPASGTFNKFIKQILTDNNWTNPNIRAVVRRAKATTEIAIVLPEQKKAEATTLENMEIAFTWREQFEDVEDDFALLMANPQMPHFGQLLYGNGGTGKAQPLYSKVATPEGFTTMGEISVGDKVITPKGGVANVIQTHPQEGLRPIYELTFSDGSKTRCDENHLWKVWKHGNIKQTAIRTLKDIKQQGLKDSQDRWLWSIPLNTEPIIFTGVQKKLEIDPYLLGALLGDGCFRGGYPSFTTVDSFIKDKIEEIVIKQDCQVSTYKKGLQYGIIKNKDKIKTQSNPYTDYLKDLNLWGTKSQTKFIPEHYKTASVEDRLAMIQGLIDTDGFVAKDGYINIMLSSEQLIDDIREIVKSLGGWASKNEKIVKYNYMDGREFSVHYNLTIVLPEGMAVASLPRKVDRAKNKSLYKKGLTIRDISYVGEEEAKCITIDSDDQLYLTDDYIITHNSYFFEQEMKSRKYNLQIKKGAMDTTTMVEWLYENRDIDAVIFDDADSVVKNANSINILKGATDTKEGRDKRIIYLAKTTGKQMAKVRADIEANDAWALNEDGEKVDGFYFNSSVIIITNLKKMDDALYSRFMQNPIFMNKWEIVEKVSETIKPADYGCTQQQVEQISEVLIALISSEKHFVEDRNLTYRFYHLGLSYIKAYPDRWAPKVLRKMGIGVKTKMATTKAELAAERLKWTGR